MMHELQRKGSMSRGSSIDKQVRIRAQVFACMMHHNNLLTDTCLIGVTNGYDRWRR